MRVKESAALDGPDAIRIFDDEQALLVYWAQMESEALSQYLRDMDPLARTSLAIFLAVTIKGFIYVRWWRFKDREARKPTQMKLKKGVYVPWGRIQRIERGINIATVIWVMYIIALLALLAYHKLISPVI